MVALHDRHKYRGDLRVLVLHLEHFMAMQRVAKSKAGPDEAKERLYLWMLVKSELEKENFVFNERGYLKEPWSMSRTQDETGEDVGIRYTQGNMADIH